MLKSLSTVFMQNLYLDIGSFWHKDSKKKQKRKMTDAVKLNISVVYPFPKSTFNFSLCVASMVPADKLKPLKIPQNWEVDFYLISTVFELGSKLFCKG